MTHKLGAILAVEVKIPPEHEEEFNTWYRAEHGPHKLALPGYTGLRRFRHHDDPTLYLAIYELEDADAAYGASGLDEAAASRMRQIMAAWERWERNVWIEVD